MEFDKFKKTILLASLFMLAISLVFLAMVVMDKKGKNEFVAEKVSLKFENRVDKLSAFDSEKYYKFGWLQVQGTHMDLPILDYNSSYDYETIDYSYGWLSSAYNEGENREVIMGHNILNVSNEPMLPNNKLANFEELMAFTYYGFAKDNLYIQYTKDGKDEVYKIYAIGFYDYDYDRAESMTDKEEIANYIKNQRKESIYDYDIDVNSDDKLLTVKTCTRYFGLDSNQQFIIDARKVRDNEAIETYQVKTTKLFEKLNLNKENM